MSVAWCNRGSGRLFHVYRVDRREAIRVGELERPRCSKGNEGGNDEHRGVHLSDWQEWNRAVKILGTGTERACSIVRLLQ
jgi:hypothetical protein